MCASPVGPETAAPHFLLPTEMTAPAFPYRHPPFPHQREALRRMQAAPDGGTKFACILEPGLGKSMITICNAAWLGMTGKADGMLVVAPRGAHTNWVKDELPKHMPIPYTALLWDSGRTGTKAFQADASAFLSGPHGFAVLAVNIDALRLAGARALIKEFVQQRRVVGVIDESADIASPSATRGRKARLLAKFLPYRRILDGTPWAESSFELYGQFGFLDKGIIGARTYSEMKATYGEWERVAFRSPDKVDADGNPRTYAVFKGFKNLDLLARRIAPYSYRKTFSEAMPGLPPRTYTKWYFQLAKETRAVYDQLKTEYLAEFPDGHEVEASHVLTRMLRLQQVAAGYVPTRTWLMDADGEQVTEPEHLIPGPNARLDAMCNAVAHYRVPLIVWCRFQYDQHLLYNALTAMGRKVAWYRGSDTARDIAKGAFQNGGADVFLADPTSGGRALTLTRAHVMIFYTHYYGLRKRIQSEFRFYRIGLDHPVLVVDLVAENTVDEKIVASHVAKEDLSNRMGQMVAQEAWY